MDRVAEFALQRARKALSFFERIRGSPFDLKHREVNHAVVELATRESGASDICLIPVEIAKRLVLRLERRLKTAYLRGPRLSPVRKLLFARRPTRPLARSAHSWASVGLSSFGPDQG
jgi:hypothetical protein